jgi:hypothetical protein
MQSLKHNQILIKNESDIPALQIKLTVNYATYYQNNITLPEADIPPL